MNIKQAKQEIMDTVQAYLMKDEYGEYVIPSIHQRPVLILGAPGIGKTQIMEQAARECKVALVSYTITHHTRQSAIGLPFISKKEYGGRDEGVETKEQVAFLQKIHAQYAQGYYFSKPVPVKDYINLCLENH